MEDGKKAAEEATRPQDEKRPIIKDGPTAESVAKEEENISLPHTMQLVDPFEFMEETITQITFRNRITAAMVAHIGVGDMENGTFQLGTMYPIISKMTGEFPLLIDQLGFKDTTAAIGVVTSFL